MIGFEVQVNREEPITAGLSGHGVLSVILSLVDLAEPKGPELTLDLGGLRSVDGDTGEHLKWIAASLRVGDSVTVTVVDVAASDEPATREREDPTLVEAERRRFYDRLKLEYEGGD